MIRTLLVSIVLMTQTTIKEPLFKHHPIKEDRMRIVVVDTGVSITQLRSPALCKDTQNLADLLSDEKYRFHGINVFGLIEDNLNDFKYCIYPIYWAPGTISTSLYYTALEKIMELNNVVGVNLSLTTSKKEKKEEYYMKEFIKKNIVVNAAGGNEFKRITEEKNCKIYPACYKLLFKNDKRFNVVISNTGDFSNSFDIFETVEANGMDRGYPVLSGTSQATAVFTGLLFSK